MKPQQPPAPQQSLSMNASASSMNSSAFGLDLGGGPQGKGAAPTQQPMMTTSMMATNNQAQMNMMNQMNQMQQMQSMMAQMQNMNMNPNMMNQMNPNMMAAQMNQMRMNQGNMMGGNMNMMQQPQTQQPSLFAQALQGVNGPAQQQAPKSSYRSSNDPFSGLTGGSQAAQATQAPTQPPQPKGPDPFAQFGLNSMQ